LGYHPVAVAILHVHKYGKTEKKDQLYMNFLFECFVIVKVPLNCCT